MEGFVVDPEYLALRYARQDSDEYHDKRHGMFSLTASEVPDVFGKGFSSRHALWMYKVQNSRKRPPPFVQEMLDRGKEQEEPLVQQLLPVVGGECFPTGCWAYAKDERLGASPDRRLLRDGRWYLVEAKTRQSEGAEPRLPTEANWLQIQTQLAVLNYRSCYYVCNNLNGDAAQNSVPIVCEIVQDRDCWDFLIYPQLCFFMEAMEHKEEPPSRQYKKTDFLPYMLKSVYQII